MKKAKVKGDVSGSPASAARSLLTERYKQALQFAAQLHQLHRRKGSNIPYLSHLLSVSALVMENGGSEDEAIAGLLHDAIEDQGNDYVSAYHGSEREGRAALKQDIQWLFGERVRKIVEACTDDEYLPRGRKIRKGSLAEWKRRKSAYLKKLAGTTDAGALRVSCADKLHNARAILGDYENQGEKFWALFTAKTKEDQLWYYSGLAKEMTEGARCLNDGGLERLARRLTAVVDEIARL